MTIAFDLLLQGGQIVTPEGVIEADIGVKDGRIAAIGTLEPRAAEIFAANGLTILPGVIDSHVHLREPGFDYQEDVSTGTAAAAMGGVTALCDMPDTRPATLDAAALSDKLARAKGRAWVDHAFFIGATAANIEHLAALEALPGCAGAKISWGGSDGLPADDAALLRRAFAAGRRRLAIDPLECDSETAIGAAQQLLHLARDTARPLQALQVTSAAEIDLLAAQRDLASIEVSPQHLTLPAADGDERRAALWRAVQQGVVDIIGSGHAPLLPAEKAAPDSPSGLPGLQTLVPVMLDHVAAGRLSLTRFAALTSSGPARLYGMKGKGRIALGYDADFTLVDLKVTRRIKNQWIVSKCGWTPYDGMKVTGWPLATIIRGIVVMREDMLLGDPIGTPIRFIEMLRPDQ